MTPNIPSAPGGGPLSRRMVRATGRVKAMTQRQRTLAALRTQTQRQLPAEPAPRAESEPAATEEAAMRRMNRLFGG